MRALPVQRIMDLGHCPGRIETTMDRVKAPRGADRVIIVAGSTEVWRDDIEVPNWCGSIPTSAGRAAPGIFRVLRTIP